MFDFCAFLLVYRFFFLLFLNFIYLFVLFCFVLLFCLWHLYKSLKSLNSFVLIFKASCRHKSISMQRNDVYVLRSPHFTQPYPNNVNCSWIFIARDGGMFIILPGRIIDIEDYDNLTIGRGLTISRETTAYHYPRHAFAESVYNTSVPKMLVINNMSMWVTFTSDGYGTLSGFYIIVKREIKGNKILTQAHFNTYAMF